jgi:adenine-specific DNA-methyltransferase
MEDFFKPKIVYIEIMTDNPKEGYEFPCFSFDENNCVVLNTAYIMNGDYNSLKYILGVLNSNIGKQLVKLYVTQLQQRQFRMLHQYVINFPIPKLSESSAKIIITEIDNILNEKGESIKLNKSANKINKMIYSAYGLTFEEISFIESLQNQ